MSEIYRIPAYDFHTHTKYLGCANETMEIPAIIERCEALGFEALAITDHLNTWDDASKHLLIRDDLEKISPSIKVFFGVELNFMGCDGDFAYNQELKEQLGFQFAIGGIHESYLKEYDLSKLIEIQHRHHILVCQNPLVDVLVHPYWFWKGEFTKNNWPWFDSMNVVPKNLTRELGQIARDTHTAIEINAKANLCNPAYSETYVEEYYEYLSILKEEGVVFSLASDAHDINDLENTHLAWDMAKRLGLREEQIWYPACSPFL